MDSFSVNFNDNKNNDSQLLKNQTVDLKQKFLRETHKNKVNTNFYNLNLNKVINGKMHRV